MFLMHTAKQTKMLATTRSKGYCLGNSAGADCNSETGRIRFRRVRFQRPNSVSFSALTEFGGESSVSSSRPIYLCTIANSPSLSQNSPSLPRELSEFSLPKKQYEFQDVGKGGLSLRGAAFMTVLAVLTVLVILESTLPSFCLSYKMQ